MKIVTTKSCIIKLLSIILILGTFVVGVWIISKSVSDFYKFDTITDIRGVSPDNLTFPAITICVLGVYWRTTNRNGSVIKRDRILSGEFPLISNFLDFNYNPANHLSFNVSNHIDYFVFYHDIYYPLDCFRFNAFTNKSVGLLKAISNQRLYRVKVNEFYVKNISKNEYYNYSIDLSINLSKYSMVFIGDNYLNSLKNTYPLSLPMNFHHEYRIKKESTEIRLPEPYNRCKEASVNEPNHRWNCIEACIYKQVATNYNCSFPLSLFHIPGLKPCPQMASWTTALSYLGKFSDVCKKKCPLESCFYEKFSLTVEYSEKILQANTTFIFYFSDFSSLNISQIPKTDPFTFLNNIGGGLGLFMGIALPNLIEFLQFISEIIVILFS